MAVQVNLSKGLDKAYENVSLKDVLDAKPSALAGLTERHDEVLSGFGIKTVRDLGTNKHFSLAAALVAMEAKEG